MYIDANYILRYMLNDIPQQAEEVVAAIAGGADTYPEIIPEVVYVLEKVYKVGRDEIADALSEVLQEIGIKRKEVIIEALRLYKSVKLDYVDCLMLAGFSMNRQDFLSFNQKLMKLKSKIAASALK